MNHALILAEQIVDWVSQDNSPQKDSLKTFRLGLTSEGIAILNAVLSVLRPVVCYQASGEDCMISSKFSRKTLLHLASIAVRNLP